MKFLKYRDKRVSVQNLLKMELERIHSRSTNLNVRRSARRASQYLNDIIEYLEDYESDRLAIQSLEDKNFGLAQAVQKERMRNNQLLMEKFKIQSSYHHFVLERRKFEEGERKLKQQIAMDQETCKNLLPNILAISDYFTKKITKLDDSCFGDHATESNDIMNVPLKTYYDRCSGESSSDQSVVANSPLVRRRNIWRPKIYTMQGKTFHNETCGSLFDNIIHTIRSPISEESEMNISLEKTLRRKTPSNTPRARKSSRLGKHSTSLVENHNNHMEVTHELESTIRSDDVTKLLKDIGLPTKINNTSERAMLKQSTFVAKLSHDSSPKIRRSPLDKNPSMNESFESVSPHDIAMLQENSPSKTTSTPHESPAKREIRSTPPDFTSSAPENGGQKRNQSTKSILSTYGTNLRRQFLRNEQKLFELPPSEPQSPFGDSRYSGNSHVPVTVRLTKRQAEEKVDSEFQDSLMIFTSPRRTRSRSSKICVSSQGSETIKNSTSTAEIRRISKRTSRMTEKLKNWVEMENTKSHEDLKTKDKRHRIIKKSHRI